jgi:hypothetical protein
VVGVVDLMLLEEVVVEVLELVHYLQFVEHQFPLQLEQEEQEEHLHQDKELQEQIQYFQQLQVQVVVEEVDVVQVLL